VVCLALFLVLTAAVMTGRMEQWDSRLTLAIAADRPPWLTGIMKLLSLAGSGAIEIPFGLLIIAGSEGPKSGGTPRRC
jgi:hypothetical protein